MCSKRPGLLNLGINIRYIIYTKLFTDCIKLLVPGIRSYMRNCLRWGSANVHQNMLFTVEVKVMRGR